jgi:hypothetical protein
MASKVDQFIPEFWSASILRAKENSLVFGALANRNYEGEIKAAGDRVYINQIGDININDYTKNSTSTLTRQFLSDGQTHLDIDQAKYFDFSVDKIDKVQPNINLVLEAAGRAAYELNNTADQFLAGLYGQCGIQRNSSNSPVNMTSTNIETEFLTVAENLMEANADENKLFAVVPPWVITKLGLAGITSLTDNVDMWKNGFRGMAYGFKIYKSNNVSKSSTAWAETRIICGVEGESFTYAEQLLEVESYRMTNEGFGDVVKGLNNSSMSEKLGNENPVNCWEVFKNELKKISSQAKWEHLEGSETRSRSPERTVKAHECRTSFGMKI